LCDPSGNISLERLDDIENFTDLIKKRFSELLASLCLGRRSCPEADVLEISPFVAPRCFGPSVRYFDVLNRSELIKKAFELDHWFYNQQLAQLSDDFEIDYVDPNGNLDIIDRKFLTIFSSHCLVRTHIIYAIQLLSPADYYTLPIASDVSSSFLSC
jgi:hypothetical protein